MSDTGGITYTILVLSQILLLGSGFLSASNRLRDSASGGDYCPRDQPSTATGVGIYCGQRAIVHWPDGPASNVDIYYGIRYARPPTGVLRFRKPVSYAANLSQVIPATQPPPSCPQRRSHQLQHLSAYRMWQPEGRLSEDCLFLNIWLPSPNRDVLNSTSSLKAVMIWIHGGDFSSGSASLDIYDGRILAARQNVIVVAMNFRLGPLGFTTLDTDEIPGNMGLWDQRLAMQWVHQNIHHFGGDPNLVTLFGSSSGAVSINFHLITPWSQLYYKNAILQSGTFLQQWQYSQLRHSIEKTKQLASIVGCNLPTSGKIAACLREKAVEQLLDAHESMATNQSARHSSSQFLSIQFPPVLDNRLIPVDRSHRLTHTQTIPNRFKRPIRLLVGFNQQEANLNLLKSFGASELDLHDYTNYLRLLAAVINANPENRLGEENGGDVKPSNIANSSLLLNVDFEYTEEYTSTNHPVDWIDKVGRVASDRYFKCPLINLANKLTRWQSNQVYLYEFRHQTDASTWPHWLGSTSGQEVEYVLGKPFSPKFQANYYAFSDEERRLSDMMMTYWANFARTGDPNLLPDNWHILELLADKLDDSIGEEFKGEVVHSIEAYLSRVRLPTALRHCQFTSWPVYDKDRQPYKAFRGQVQGGQTLTLTKPRWRQCLYWEEWFPILMNLRTYITTMIN